MQSGMSTLFSVLRRGTFLSSLNNFDESALQPVLPTLLRASLLPNSFCAPPSSHNGSPDAVSVVAAGVKDRLLDFESANFVLSLISVDFTTLDAELKKAASSSLADIQSLGGPAFESADPLRKHLILLSYLLAVDSALTRGELGVNTRLRFEPLDNALYLDECCSVLVVAWAELRSMVQFGSARLVRVLLMHSGGPTVVQRLALNYPARWNQLVEDHLTTCPVTSADEDFNVEQRRKSLLTLLELWPERSLDVVQMLIEKRVTALQSLVLELLCDADRTSTADLVLHLESLVFDDANLLQHLINTGQRKAVVPDALVVLKSRLQTYCDDLVLAQTDANAASGASDVLRVIAALKNATNLKFGADLMRSALALLCTRPPPSTNGLQLVKTALATLLSTPSLLTGQSNDSQHDADAQLIDWLKWVVQNEFTYFDVLGESYGELLLLIAIQFHTNQTTQLSQLASGLLGFKVNVQSKLIQRIRTIFVTDLMDDRAVAARAARLTVTDKLNDEMDGYLPIHCVLQLLKARSFSKHRIMIGDWILRQIKVCSTPIHQAIPELLEAYSRSCVCPPRSTEIGASRNTIENETFSEKILKDYFSLDRSLLSADNVVPQVLLLYYLLCYESLLEAEAKKLFQTDKSFTVYTEEFWDDIPVRLLLAYVKQTSGFDAVETGLSRLSAIQCPHLAPDKIEPLPLLKKLPDLDAWRKRLFACSAEFDGGKRLKCLTDIDRKTALEKLALMPALVDLIPECLRLEDSTAQQAWPVLTQLLTIWTSVENVDPIRLYCATAQCILASSADKTAAEDIVTSTTLLHDPLAVLRGDWRIFRNPVLLQMVLRILQFYLWASRLSLKKQLIFSSPIDLSGYRQSAQEIESEREELIWALIRAQESAAVQILLEACKPLNESEVEGATDGRLGVLREIRCLICSFVHRMYIEDPLLAKLVHFQGYSASLLPITVRGIPSMHVCFDFLPELLAQPDMSKRVFACHLLAELSRQFTVAAAFSRARLLVNVYTTLLNTVPGKVNTARRVCAWC